MRALFIAAVCVAALTLGPKPAMAAMCGPSGDVAAVANRTVVNFNAGPKRWKKIDKTYIMQLAVDGAYAQVDLDFPQGPIFAFWIKKMGTWTYAGTSAPHGWPAGVAKKLAAMNTAGPNGAPTCANPNWINRSSSG